MKLTEQQEHLGRIIAEGEVVGFVGAGMSCPQYPDWNTLINAICQNCRLFDRRPDLDLNDPLRLAGLAKATDLEMYEHTIRTLLGAREEISERYRHLADLAIPSFVTTNFENSLEDAVKKSRGVACCCAYPAPLNSSLERNGVYFVHGRLPQSSSSRLEIVLTDHDFEMAYQGSILPSFLLQLFAFNKIVFLGCSLRDVYLERVLRLCAASVERYPSDAREWYLVTHETAPVPDGLDHLGFRIVRYEKLNDDHDGLTQLLASWKELGGREISAMDESVSYSDASEHPRV